MKRQQFLIKIHHKINGKVSRQRCLDPDPVLCLDQDPDPVIKFLWIRIRNPGSMNIVHGAALLKAF